MTITTMHTFAHHKSWPNYHAAYLAYMQRTNHPDLAKSNYNASTWKMRNLNVSIPVLVESQIYGRWPP